MKNTFIAEISFSQVGVLFHFIVYLLIYLFIFLGCSTILNETYGHIELTTTSYNDLRCTWNIHNAGIRDAFAFISVQELSLYHCRYGEVISFK